MVEAKGESLMDQFLLFAAGGLGAGAVYAALSLGLIVTFKATGVINFAAGVIGLWAGYIYQELRAFGEYVFPVVIIPAYVHVGRPDQLVAVLVAVATAMVLGVAVHFFVFRPLREAPALAKVVASAGVMLALQALIVLRFGTDERSVAPILPNKPLQIAGIGVPRDRLWLAGVVIVLGIIVTVWLRRTRHGLALQAAAENRQFASFARFSPDVLAVTGWAVSSGCTALLVVLAAPLTGLNPVSYTLLVVPALACALVGRLERVGVAVAAGLILGIVQSETTFYATETWWPQWATVGVGSVIPFVVVVVVLFALGRSLPTRDAERVAALPAVRPPVAVTRNAVIAPVVGIALIMFTHGSYRFGIVTSMIVSVVALSFVVLTGLLGQVSFAQVSFAGVAAFALSKLTQHAGIAFPWAPLLAAGIAAVCGLLVGIPALRIRGAQLAIATLALALAVDQLLFQNPSFNDIANGNLVTSPSLLGLNLAVRGGASTARVAFAILVLVVLVLCCLAVNNWMRAGTGRRLVAVRSNERASASLGIDVVRTKLLGFTFSALLAGVGGALLAYSDGSVSSDSFVTLVGISYLAYAYLGGITSVSGALIAGTLAPLGIAYTIVNRVAPSFSQTSYQLVAALGLIVTAVVNPGGIAGGLRTFSERAQERFRRLSWVPDGPVGQSLVRQVDDAPRDRVRLTTPTAATGRTGLQLRGVSVDFGGVRALEDVTLEVRPGQIVGLIGANGAGKTTLIDAVSGFVSASGQVCIGERSIESQPAYRRSRLGLARSWQSGELVDDLTVTDNLRVAHERMTLGTAVSDLVRPLTGRDDQRVADVLGLVGLPFDSRYPRELSLGEQKLVSVARCLVGAPSVLLLDEPAAGLSTDDTNQMASVLRGIVSDQMCALLVEHDVAMVMNLCDHIYVLDFGRIIAHGSPAEIRHNAKVIAAYLGAEPEGAVHR